MTWNYKVIALAGALTASIMAADWPVLQGNPGHEGFVAVGIEAPLKQSWMSRPPGDPSPTTTWPVVSGGQVIASSGSGVLSVDRTNGKVTWFSRRSEGQSLVGPAVADSRVFIPLPNGKLAALSSKDGKDVWTVQAQGDISGSPLATSGKVIFGTSQNHLYAVDADTGAISWETRTELPPTSVPAGEENVIVVSEDDPLSRRLVVAAFDLENGSPLWEAEQYESASSPSIRSGVVYFGGGDGFAYALKVSDGSIVWKSKVVDKFANRNMPALAYGDVFLADRVGNIYRLDGKTGKRKWIFSDTEGTFDQSSPVISGKTLYIGSGAGWLYGVNVDTGRLVWKHHIDGFIQSGALDEKHFFFGVKFGKEGLYAYEHDPKAKALAQRPTPNVVGSVILAFIALAVLAVVLMVMNRSNPPPKQPELVSTGKSSEV